MPLSLPQALAELDRHAAVGLPPGLSLQVVEGDPQIQGTPPALGPPSPPTSTLDASLTRCLSGRRMADLDACHAALDAAQAAYDRQVLADRKRSFGQKARAYFPAWWAQIRGDTKAWFGLAASYGFFALTGAAFAVHLHENVWAGAGWGALMPFTMMAVLMAWTIQAEPSEVEPPSEQLVKALDPWTPQPEELLLWRSLPAVHALVAAHMRSPIGLRQGDRPSVEALVVQVLAELTEGDALLARFIQSTPEEAPPLP